MTIAKRILLLLLVAIAALLLLGGIGLYEQQQGKARFDAAIDNIIPSVREINEAKAGFIDIRAGVTSYLIARSPESKKAAEEAIQAGDQRLDAALAKYEKDDLANDDDRKMLADDRNTLAGYRAARQQLIEKINAGDAQQVETFYNTEVKKTSNTFRKALNDHFSWNLSYTEDIRKRNTAAYDASLLTAGGVFLAALVVVVLLGFRILKTVKSRLAEMSGTMLEISRTLDMTRRLPVSGDEIGQASRAFNELAQRLHGNLGSLLSGAREVAAAAQSLSQTSGQVASAAASQSEASSNVAATVEQMTVSVNHVADRAQQTLGLAANAGSLAREGSTTITQTIADIRQISRAVDEAGAGIRELDQFSRQVNAVVGVIKDIADQTNLLALNASIEAARAGEMGRGFAVVADEVRQLAERTTASTQEIGSTISAMQQRTQQASNQMQAAEELVRNGVARADGADQAIQNIGRATHDTAGMVGDISSAIKEQGVATNNIAQQVEGIAQMSEQSNAAAQETAGSAQRLDQLAKGQIETLSSYRL